MDISASIPYLPIMTAIVSPVDRDRFVKFLEKVGGYDEVMRLNRELRRVRAAGGEPKMIRDGKTKKYRVTAANA